MPTRILAGDVSLFKALKYYGVLIDIKTGTEYIEAIFVFTFFTIAAFGLPETYAPVLLARRARDMRHRTGNQRYWHPHEDRKMDVRSIITKHLSRPLLYVL
jgi:hypothetical protein